MEELSLKIVDDASCLCYEACIPSRRAILCWACNSTLSPQVFALAFLKSPCPTSVSDSIISHLINFRRDVLNPRTATAQCTVCLFSPPHPFHNSDLIKSCKNYNCFYICSCLVFMYAIVFMCAIVFIVFIHIWNCYCFYTHTHTFLLVFTFGLLLFF